MISRGLLAPVALLASTAMLAAPALAEPAPASTGGADVTNSASAMQVLKRMSDYLASQPNLSVKFDAELDIITPAIEKIQFSASGDVLLSRPNKFHARRNGGYNEVEVISDGTTVTILSRGDKSFSQISSPGSVDMLIDMLRTKYGVDMPGADLLLTNSYNELMAGVLMAKHIGVGVIDNLECEHLAFRNADTDWQLWVRTGDKPLPCKYVIATKTVAASPEYTIRFREWATPPSIPASAFAFTPPKGGTAVPFEQLTEIGELPSPAPFSSGDK